MSLVYTLTVGGTYCEQSYSDELSRLSGYSGVKGEFLDRVRAA